MTDRWRPQESEPVMNLREYLTVFQRRRTLIFLAAGLLLCLAVTAAILWPPTFKVHGHDLN